MKGDRIVQMAGTRIDTLQDMTFALQDHRPGETIDVVVLREENKVTLRATLGERGAAPAAAPPAAAPPAEAKVPPAAPAPPAGPSFYADRPGAAFVIGAGKPFPARPDERHLLDVRQLTFGGENAEAYWSPDGRHLVFQSTSGGGCDQQYVMDLATGDTTPRLHGQGKDDLRVLRLAGVRPDRVCVHGGRRRRLPPPAPHGEGYVWPLYDTYDLWEVKPDGSSPRRITDSPGYDAEATWCHRGGKLVFTSMRDGDLDLYEMDEAGRVRRLTSTVGYDGGAFYNADCTEIVWRASRPQGPALEDYEQLLAKSLIRPSVLELFVMKADGTDVRQVTSNGAANFCPYFHPDGKRIIYASNAGDPRGREFDLWVIDKNGANAERITVAEGFDGFPVWSPDGVFLVWASNRADPAGHQTNLFIARWVE